MLTVPPQKIYIEKFVHADTIKNGYSQFFSDTFTQRAEEILNNISNNINNTYTWLISVLQGFQKCIA